MPVSSSALPRRSGLGPKTIRGPLHVQCTGHGDANLLHQIIQEVLDWPQIESKAPFVGYQDTVSIRLRETACTDNASAFISGKEFARVLLKAPTIYLALPLECAHWAIVRGWAEPHYLTSYGLIPAGVVVLYTPRDEGERAVCYALFAESYNFACKLVLQAAHSHFKGGNIRLCSKRGLSPRRSKTWPRRTRQMTRVKSFQNNLGAVTGASRGIGFEIGKEALLSE